MKKYFYVSLLILTLMSFIKISKEINIDIIESNNYEDTKINTTLHKEKEVFVFKSVYEKENKYTSILYREENNKLAGYKATISSTINLKKASYKWINQTTVEFKLINEKNSAEYTYRVSGKGNETSLEIITKP